MGINATDAISDIQHEYKKVNHQFGKKCMEAIIEKLGLSFYVEANCEVKGMRDLPQLCSNSIERSDIIVYTDSGKKHIVLTGEIKSSPMLWTERKASIGAANLLRLLRSSNSNINSITTFAFPNMQSNECIIKIEMTWHDYKFKSKLTRYTTIPEGIDSIFEVMGQQNEEIPRVVSRHLMKLSPEECNVLCKSSSSVQILSSRHIILIANDKVYKIIYSLQEKEAFYVYYHRVEGRHCNFIIHPKIEREGSTLVYTYECLPYSPLDVTNAKKCLRSLVQDIKTALPCIAAFAQ